MRCLPRRPVIVLAVAIAFLAAATVTHAGRRRPAAEPAGHLTFASPQSNPIALSPDQSLLVIAQTVSNRVDLVDVATGKLLRQVEVGLEPVSVAFRPDGQEVWVANHVSDSVSVIDTAAGSASYLEVVETIQQLDSNGATRFDEPVGIAFASNTKAYVALSSLDQIAVIDAAAYDVAGHLDISGQDPRAITVAGGLLFVAVFESNNQTQLSLCNVINGSNQPGDPCSMGLRDLQDFATTPNLPGVAKNIVVDPALPDRDVFVFDTSNDALVDVVEHVGTLLYGVAADGAGRVYVTQTDARNAANGTEGDNLPALGNKLFDNEVAILDCSGGSGCSIAQTVELEPDFPNPATALATPFGVAVSPDGALVVGTAAGTHRLFTLDATGTLLGRVDVGSVPKGVALLADPETGAAVRAYVLNTLSNSVSIVDLTDPTAPQTIGLIAIGGDPTPDDVRRGRIAFSNAFASDSGNFSCESCHPDGNTDQLLWRIGGACVFGACTGDDEPRTTMPVRGLRDTVPLHWDGTLGDPWGGTNGALGGSGSEAPVCDPNDQQGCFRHLVDASLSGVMCDQSGGCATGPSGLPGRLTTTERDEMAAFLEVVSYPPPRARPVDDDITPVAEQGFRDFFMDQGGNPNTCADSNAGCHELPLTTGTNSQTLDGFDAPTMRGLTDRFLQFSMGITSPRELLELANVGTPLGGGTQPLEPAFAWDPVGRGLDEKTTFGAAFLVFESVYGTRPVNMFQMFEEASTGHSGAVGRQLTLSSRTANVPLATDTEALLAALEQADTRGFVNLKGHGVRAGQPSSIEYVATLSAYRIDGADVLDRAALLGEAATGQLRATLTAHLPTNVSEANPQPLIAPLGANCQAGVGPTGDPELPEGTSFFIEARHVDDGDVVIVDGAPTGGAVASFGGPTPCESDGADSIADEVVFVDLGIALADGMHLLQLQKPSGLHSNEMPFCVGNANVCNP